MCDRPYNEAVFVPHDPIANELKIYNEQVSICNVLKFEMTEREQAECDDQMQLLKTHHVPVNVPLSKEELELAEATRNKLHVKMNDSACVEKRYQNLKERFGNKKPVTSSDAPSFDSLFVIRKLNKQIQSRGNTIRELKEKISLLTEKNSDADPTLDLKALVSQNKDLTAKLNALHDLNECFRAETAKVKQHYKELYDSIKITRAKTTDQDNSLLSEIENLKAQLKDNSKCVTIPDSKPKVLAPGRYPIDVELVPPRLKKNHEVHLHYIKHLKEIVETLREIVKEAKVKRSLDTSLASACRYTKHSQELQFCDSDLEVAFRKHTCFVRDLDGVDLIKGSREAYLRLKFEKDHLCSASQLGKSRKATYKPKMINTITGVLHTLHLDLCGSLRVQSINGKKYILVNSAMTTQDYIAARDKADILQSSLNSLDEADGYFAYLGKLKAKADIRFFVGYAPNRKGYRIYNKRIRQIMETIHITFDELTKQTASRITPVSGPSFLTFDAWNYSSRANETKILLPCYTPVEPVLFSICMSAKISIKAHLKSTLKQLNVLIIIACLSDTRRSTSGGAQFLDAGLKYQIMWLCITITSHHIVNNKSAIALCCNNVQHSSLNTSTSNIISIKEQVKGRWLSIDFVRTEYQLAAIFTSALPRRTILIHSLAAWHKNTMTDVDVNAPAELAPTMAPPTRTDDQILPHIRWVPIGKSNCYLDVDRPQSNPIFKIAVDLLKHTNFFQAFTASSAIPAIYIQQFWDTIRYDKIAGGYKCQLDEQWFDLSKDTLRDALQITPIDKNNAFSSPPTPDALIKFVNDLGYPKVVRHLSDVVTNDMFQPWRALTTIINLCLTGKTSGFERPRAPVLQILWGVINRAHIDYAERMWEEFTQSIHTFIEDKKNLAQHTQGKKKATLIVIPSIRFTKLIIHYLQSKHKFHARPGSLLHLPNEEPVLGYLKFSSKGTKREVFGMPIPNDLVTDDIRGKQYYNAYLEKVAKHQRYLAGEDVSDPDSPAPKPTKGAKPKTTKKPTSTQQTKPKTKPSIAKATKSTPS
ncbi:hypothetical protein Tco_0819857 [Tanacetum coccineum]|uniref:Retroviral polymerase SH3-like domain-containing protein n=1 Tax=Tanacetum coccineum TaxID=301880 RepID=A0ABQ5A8S6_9ASTR